MGLFSKKICSVCGDEIGLLGNRKLADGNLCKNCANKLSPWFTERKESTVAEISGQLRYREMNREDVETFNVTRRIGEFYQVLIDEENQKFIVTSHENWRNGNPDVLDLNMVTGCNVEVTESKSEVRKTVDGKRVSYVPAQYDYNYNFYVTLFVNHPYFQKMKFRINNSAVRVENTLVDENGPLVNPVPVVGAKQNNRPGARPGTVNTNPTINSRAQGPQGEAPVVNNDPPFAFVPDPSTNFRYNNYIDMMDEIKAALTGIDRNKIEIVVTTVEESSSED